MGAVATCPAWGDSRHHGGRFMEFRRYWDLLRRRGWIPLVLVVATALISILLTTGFQKAYSSTIRFVTMSVPQTRAPGIFNYDSYYNWLSSEYLGDDLTELVKSKDFMDAVSAQINDPTIDVESLMKSTRATRAHRVLSVGVVTGSEYETTKIAEAVATIMPSAVSRYFPQFGSEQPFIRMVDPPETKPALNAPRIALEVGLRTALALVVGLALVLMLDYLDTSIRNADEAELLLGLPIMGEIPADTYPAAPLGHEVL